jgi:hypothetical protein
MRLDRDAVLWPQHEKYSADMMVASEAEEAWWPPTFKPSVLGLM